MGFFSDCRKWTVLIFNLVFLLAGAALIVLGALSTNNLNNLTKIIPPPYHYLTTTPVILLVLGTIIAAVAIFGTVGVWKRNLFLLNSYTIVLIVIFVLQIVLSIVSFWAVSNQSDLAVSVNTTVDNVFKNHTENMDLIDFVQDKLDCCGTNGPEFWKKANSNFPKSCCEGQDCGKKVYQKGCQNAFYDFLLGTIRIIGTVILALSPLQVIGATFSLGLVNAIRNYRRRYKKYMT